MKLNKRALIIAGAVSVLALAACDATKEASQAAKNPAAATVNGKAISQRTVDMIVAQGAASGRPDTPEARKSIIEQLALQMVVADEAIKKGLDKSPEVAEQIDAVRQTVLANAYVQDFVKNTPISDEMVKAEYERIKTMISGTEYKARHILVEKESEAKEIIAKLKTDPAAFEKLAMQKSTDTSSKVRGGDLGWFDLRGMVPEFGAAVSKMEKGKFTLEPVKTQFGYHVIWLDDSRPIQAPPLESVKPQLTEQLQQKNVKTALDDLKAKAKIEIVSAVAQPAPATPTAPASK
ncbi:MAG: peptidylprolyl isomerase [Rhodocyclaceae bacterium]|nr:peptidylprolyl isomerase [Rhodocyclaceae bacterium]